MLEAHRAFNRERDSQLLQDRYMLEKEAGALQCLCYYREREELEQKIENVKNTHAAQQHSSSWKLINDISGRCRSQAPKLKAQSAEERVLLRHAHFKKLLGNPPEIVDDDTPVVKVFSNLPIPDGPFTLKEYQKVKSNIKTGKSCGEDGVTTELLKYVPLDNIVLALINKAYEVGELPEEWVTLNIIPVPKSGDLSTPDNYRGISLSSLVMKTYNRLILNRIRPVLDPLLRNSQNGFRPKRSTVGQILALRRILEGVKDKNMSCIITFIDFKKAFDTVHRGKLIEILRAYGVPEKVVMAILASYNKTWAKVVTPDGTAGGHTSTLLVRGRVGLCTELCHQWKGGGARLHARQTPE